MTEAQALANNHVTVPANNHVAVYSETFINWSCPKAETLLRSTGTSDPLSFLHAPLSHIPKAETVKRTLPQTDNFFRPSDKKATCLTRIQTKVLGVSEKLRINLDILSLFSKRNVFLHFKTVFFYSILQFLKEILLSIIARIKYYFKQFL